MEQWFLAMFFSIEKFRAYLLGFNIIIHIHHKDCRYLMAKKVSKPRIVIWELLLKEFDVEVKDQKGTKIQVVDQLSKLDEEAMLKLNVKIDIDDTFLDEQVLAVSQNFIP